MIHFDVINQEKKLKLLEEQTMNNDFWNDTENSSKVLKEINGLKSKVESFNKIQNELNNILEMSELLQLEPDEEMAKIENDYGILDINSVNLVFTKENGLFVGTDLLKYPFQIIHNELGITKCRFYDLRGSYATKILRNGVEIRDVADILGHSNIETTENYYISSSNESRKVANDVFEKITFSNVIKEISDYKINTR